MPFKIVRNDITKVSCDAIVNTANPMPVIGQGTDSVIYNAAGRDELLEDRKKIGVIERGKSAWTDSYNLKSNGIKYIIHTVGVYYCDGKNGETDILRSCYSTSLNMAKNLGCKSVAIPLLATGFYSFPKELGLQIAVDEISRFLIENEMDVILVVYDRESYLISEKLFSDIQNFIDENIGSGTAQRGLATDKNNSSVDVDTFIIQSKIGLNFQNTLQQMIVERNLDNTTVYNKAFVDRRFFSKIICNKDYIPKKMTVMALGLALELSLEEYENFLTSAGYTFMPSSKFDLIIKYCVMNKIYNLVEVDMILDSHGECCFSPE